EPDGFCQADGYSGRVGRRASHRIEWNAQYTGECEQDEIHSGSATGSYKRRFEDAAKGFARFALCDGQCVGQTRHMNYLRIFALVTNAPLHPRRNNLVAAAPATNVIAAIVASW